MDIDAKLRPLFLLQILKERTDEDNYLTTTQLCDILKREYGLDTHRTTLKSDIEVLQRAGYSIDERRSTQNQYRFIEREFEVAELTTIIDAVASSKFIAEGESNELIKKLTSLAGSHKARELKRNPNSSIEVKINFLPLLSKEDLIAKLDKLQKEKLWIIMLGILPQKLVDAILSCAEIDSEINIEDLTIEQRKKLFDNLYDKKIQISGTKGWPEAEFTSGGISIKEIDENSMESKLQKGLFFAGEILNVDGEIGGYNLSWAWASGAIAGISSAS